MALVNNRRGLLREGLVCLILGNGSASACDALELQLPRQLPDVAVHDGVIFRSMPKALNTSNASGFPARYGHLTSDQA